MKELHCPVRGHCRSDTTRRNVRADTLKRSHVSNGDTHCTTIPFDCILQRRVELGNDFEILSGDFPIFKHVKIIVRTHAPDVFGIALYRRIFKSTITV